MAFSLVNLTFLNSRKLVFRAFVITNSIWNASDAGTGIVLAYLLISKYCCYPVKAYSQLLTIENADRGTGE